MLTSCSGDGPPKTTATLAALTFKARAPELGGSVPGRGGPAALKGSGRAGRSRRARRRRCRGGRAPTRSPLRRVDTTTTWTDRRLPATLARPPRAGPGGWCGPRPPGRSATAAASAGEAGVLLGLRPSPSSTIPGRHHHPPLAAGAEPTPGPPGRRGHRPGWRCRCRRARSTPLAPGRLLEPMRGSGQSRRGAGTTSSTGKPELERHGHGARPRCPAGAVDGHRVGDLGPAARTPTSPPSPRRRRTRPRPCRCAEHRATPASGSAASVSASAARRSSSTTSTAHGTSLEDLGLGLEHAVLGPEALQVHGPDGGDHRDVGADPRAQLGDLPRAVGAHLGHEDLGSLGQVLVDRPGQPGAVVEAGGTGHHRTCAPDQDGRRSPWCSSFRNEPVMATTVGATRARRAAALAHWEGQPALRRGREGAGQVDEGGHAPAPPRRPPPGPAPASGPADDRRRLEPDPHDAPRCAAVGSRPTGRSGPATTARSGPGRPRPRWRPRRSRPA